MQNFSTEEAHEAAKKAMRLLEHMDRTEKGLFDKLLQSGFSEEAAQEALRYVKSFGYVNDERYAQRYIEGRIRTKSRQKIFQELWQKGIDRETIALAWETVSSCEQTDERELIQSLVKKKCPEGVALDDRDKRRLCAYLQRRGFGLSDIYSVIEELSNNNE